MMIHEDQTRTKASKQCIPLATLQAMHVKVIEAGLRFPITDPTCFASSILIKGISLSIGNLENYKGVLKGNNAFLVLNS